MLFGGGHIYSSDNPIQGYKPDANNYAFLTDGDGVAYTRLWNVQGSANESNVLISHQWMTDGMTGSALNPMGSKGIYLAPLKEMKVGTDGTPRAVYWSGNEALKGDSITLPPLPPLPPPTPAPPPVKLVDLAACGTTTWKVPAVGAAAGPIVLQSMTTTLKPTVPTPPTPLTPPGSTCLGIDNGTGAFVLSSCGGAAQFVILANGSISSGHGCATVSGEVSYKYAPGNVFPNDPDHGVRLVDSPAACCALCQGLANCSFWTADTNSWAKPTCYDAPGGCCFLKTAAAKGGSQPTPRATSGSSDNVPYCMDALPTLRMAACNGTATTQDWTTAGGTIKEVTGPAPAPAPPAPTPQCLRVYTAPAPPAPAPLGVLFDVEFDLTVGVVIEATLSCANTSTSAGFWVHGNDGDTTFVWNCATQTFTVGGNPIDRKPGLPAGPAVALKMLLRSTPNGKRGMAEFYVNEIMSHPFTFILGGGNKAKIGLASALPITAVTAVKAWKMTLSSDQESLA